MSETPLSPDAVTSAVIADVIAQVAGDVIDVGPMRVGPGRVARVTARGTLRRAEVRDASGDLGVAGVPGAPGAELAFDAQIPIALELVIEVAGGRYRYTADLQVQVHASIGREGDEAAVVLRQLTDRDIRVQLKAHGLQAKLLAKVGDGEGELRREVVAYVNDRFEGEDVRSLSRLPLRR